MPRRESGRKAILVLGDIQEATHCRGIIDKAISELGRFDILVNNAAHQASYMDIEDIDLQGQSPCDVLLTKAAVPHMKPGSVIIQLPSIPINPTLLQRARSKTSPQV